MKQRILWTALACLAANIALAQPRPPEPWPGVEQLTILLDLNDGQKVEVQKVLDEQRATMKAAHEEARNSGQRPSREEMKSKREEMKQATLTKLQPVLTPEQLKKFEVLMERPHPQRRPRPDGDHKTQVDGASPAT